jgi:hypothetical protein
MKKIPPQASYCHTKRRPNLIRENKQRIQLEDKKMNNYELFKEELECLEEKHKEITNEKAVDKLKIAHALGIGKSERN